MPWKQGRAVGLLGGAIDRVALIPGVTSQDMTTSFLATVQKTPFIALIERTKTIFDDIVIKEGQLLILLWLDALFKVKRSGF